MTRAKKVYEGGINIEHLQSLVRELQNTRARFIFDFTMTQSIDDMLMTYIVQLQPF